MYWRGTQGWVEVETGAETLRDRAFQLGDGVFETFRIDDGEIRHARLHRQSLETACAALALAMPDWRDVEAGVAHLHPGSGIGKLQVTRGPGARGLAPIAGLKEALFLQFSPLNDPPVALQLAMSSVRRSASSLAARFKTMSYADNLAARREAVSKGADMALLCTESGHLSGGDSANLFWLAGGEILTPSLDCGVRNGVMRQRVMAWCRAQDYRLREVAEDRSALMQAEIAWMTNAVLGVVPVAAIDGRDMPTGDDLLTALKTAGL